MQTTTEYTSRQLDLELLQSVQRLDEQQVILSNVAGTPRVVAGLEKMIQRYTLLLLSNVGDVEWDSDQGTQLVSSLMAGAVQDRGQLQQVFALANVDVITQMRDDDRRTATFGSIPDDEQIASAALEDFDIDFSTSTVMLRVRLTSVAGSGATFVIPATVVG